MKTTRQLIIQSPRLARFKSTTDFGYKQVNKDEKENLVKEVFTKVAQRYDIMNDLMSLGIHRFWKDEFVRLMGLQALKSLHSKTLPRHLDVAGGTGDIAFRSCQHFSESFKRLLERQATSSSGPVPQSERPIVVCDINPDMLAVGRDRAPKVLGEEKSKMVKAL